MKKLVKFLLVMTMITGCSSTSSKEKGPSEKPIDSNEQVVEEKKSLVVYFSIPETTNPENMTTDEANSTVVIDGKVYGNTQYVAMIIEENTGADSFRLEPKEAYTTDHKALVQLAEIEKKEHARPELLSEIENFDQYTTIYVGYPIWFADMPMILYSFFDTYNFDDKTIILFSTHGGSGLAGTVEKVKEIEPNANVVDNAFTTSRNDVENVKQELISWLASLK